MEGEFELREPGASYSGHFKAKMGDIGFGGKWRVNFYLLEA